MPRKDNILHLPPDLPVPVADGLARHLLGLPVAKVSLPSTSERVWYPVFPPDRNAEQVLDWLRSQGS